MQSQGDHNQLRIAKVQFEGECGRIQSWIGEQEWGYKGYLPFHLSIFSHGDYLL